jgi:signal transduction histidine kinase
MATTLDSKVGERRGFGRAALRNALEIVGYLSLYIALDWASLIPPQPGAALGITPWNPPAGLSVALLIRYGWRFAPIVFVAVAIGDVLFRGLPIVSFVTLASAALVAFGYGAAVAVMRPRISLRLDSHNDLLYLLGVAFVATMLVALSVVAVFAFAGLLSWPDYSETVLHFWVGDMIGIAVLTPFLLLVLERRPQPERTPPVIEYIFQIAAVWAGLWVIFGWEPTDHFEYSYVLFLPLIWIALRAGLLGTTCGILATQLGLILAIQLKGLDAAVTTQFQLLMLTVAITGLLLGSVVNERRRAEASLRDSEARLQMVVRIAPDAILTFDEWGIVTSANQAAARMFAADEGGPLGADVHRLLGIAPGDRRGSLSGREVAAQRLDGTIFPAEVAVGETPLGGRLLSVAVIRDVTTRKQAELWLKEHEAELAHAMRLTATGEMAAALAHELNQPLTALIGFARACQEVLRGGDAAAREAASKLIDQAVQQALRAGDIIRSTREFLRRGDTQFVRTEIGEIFRAVLDLIHAETVLNRVGIITRFEKDLPPILADRIQIEQVIFNLIRNSIEAMVGRDGREIALSAAVDPGDPGFVQIAVSDNGPGVPAEVADRLFRPFATTKDAGMGLGLSISRSIVEAHGGRIWSQPKATGNGSDMRFTLPLYTDVKSDL